MPKEKKLDNPHGLTYKQRMVVEDIAKKIKEGKPIDAVSSTEKFYETSTKASAQSITSQNFRRKNFREALLEQLDSYGVTTGGLISTKLAEGLEATTEKGDVDFNARLKYIQEINKVTGVYAPTEKKTMSLNLDITEAELDEKIKELQEELNM